MKRRIFQIGTGRKKEEGPTQQPPAAVAPTVQEPVEVEPEAAPAAEEAPTKDVEEEEMISESDG